MKIVVPVSLSDCHLLKQWGDVVRHFHCGFNHSLHFVFPPSVESYVEKAKEDLRGEFDAIELHRMQIEPQGGWPYAPNVQFYQSARIMAADPQSPWLYNELDCLPVRPFAYDAIAARYANAGAPFFGSVNPTFWRDESSGRITPSMIGKDDTTLSGCAVYPGNLVQRGKCRSMMVDLMKGVGDVSGAPKVGWDVHLRFAFKSEGIASSNLIQDNWNTINYRVEGGGVVCDVNDQHETYRKNPHYERRPTNKPLGDETVLVHGCKDSSLADLVLAGQIPSNRYVPAPVVIAPVTVTATSPDADKIKQLEAKLAQMMAMMSQMPVAPQPAPQPEEAPAPVERPKIAPMIPPAEDTEERREEIFKMVKTVGNIRLATLARNLGMHQDDVATIIGNSIPSLNISAKPARWVSLTKST